MFNPLALLLMLDFLLLLQWVMADTFDYLLYTVFIIHTTISINILQFLFMRFVI